MSGRGVLLHKQVRAGWLAIRSGSIYRLVFALNHGVAETFAPELVHWASGTMATFDPRPMDHGTAVNDLLRAAPGELNRPRELGTIAGGGSAGVCDAWMEPTL